VGFHTVTIHRGATAQSVLVTAATMSGPAVGLRHDSTGARAGFVRTDGRKGEIPLAAGTPGQWGPGGLVEIDADLAPGVYQFDVPDTVLAEGAVRAVVVIQAHGVVFDPIDFDLVAFDPQEPDRIGMESLAFEQRVKCLTTAFPLLAAREQERLRAQERQA
jgi:hypothetical protein